MAHPQAGILNRPPDHLLIASYAINATAPQSAHTTIAGLRSVVQRELTSALDNTNPSSDKATPSDETGELGFDPGYDRYHLTITVGFSKSAYEKLGVAAEQQPQDLIPIPWDLLHDSPQVVENGDILVQICSESVYVNEHVFRRIEEELADEMTLTWVVSGSQRHTSRTGRVNREEGRALIGFLDGTSNLDPRGSVEDQKLVFVDPTNVAYPPQFPPIAPSDPNPYAQGNPVPTFPPDLRVPPAAEPSWVAGGSYAVVRASAVDLARWDDVPLGEQEQIVGRWKVSGSAFDKADDPNSPPASPDFAADPSGVVTRFAAHIRKANPRGPGDDERRIFRRGYPLVSAEVSALKRGLVFIAFGRTLTTQFEFITRAWTTNENFPLPGAGVDLFRQFESVLCGGYFFIPPLDLASEPWSWRVPPQA